MHARHILLAVLAAAVTLTSVASAGPAAAKQRVAIDMKILPKSTFVLMPLQAGVLERDSGTISGNWRSIPERSVMREGQQRLPLDARGKAGNPHDSRAERVGRRGKRRERRRLPRYRCRRHPEGPSRGRPVRRHRRRRTQRSRGARSDLDRTPRGLHDQSVTRCETGRRALVPAGPSRLDSRRAVARPN